ncbi:MAG: rhodanese-like domain-containing protein [Planctomycetes bacterium]|nr:rhodanese-like domain-containing protein [Planctomycetota bacterium]MCB9919551.1 rhodanese-like domain-containing protein [Planctomycetota bacterium]
MVHSQLMALVSIAAVVIGLLSSCTKDEEKVVDTPPVTEATPIDIDELPVWLRASKGRYAVDLRDPGQFVSGHLRGAINLQSEKAQFDLRAQRLFPAGSRLALLGEDPQRAERLAKSITARFPGSRWFVDKASRLNELGHPMSKQKTIEPREAFEELRKADALLIDVRTAKEYLEGHVPSAVFIYPDDFIRQMKFLQPGRTILVISEDGWRSSLIVSLLDHYQFTDARNVIVGMKGWRAANLPTESGADQHAFK